MVVWIKAEWQPVAKNTRTLRAQESRKTPGLQDETWGTRIKANSERVLTKNLLDAVVK
jgi:hypothetical protein